MQLLIFANFRKRFWTLIKTDRKSLSALRGVGPEFSTEITDFHLRNVPRWTGHVKDGRFRTAGRASSSAKAENLRLLSEERADEPGKRADWVDFGRDSCTEVTYENKPGDKRMMIAWMNNWDYANQIPTSPWRSMQSFPREVSLKSAGNGEIYLVREPAKKMRQLRSGPHFSVRNWEINNGAIPLSGRGSGGKALEIIAEFEVGDAAEFGVRVRKGDSEETIVGLQCGSRGSVHRPEQFRYRGFQLQIHQRRHKLSQSGNRTPTCRCRAQLRSLFKNLGCRQHVQWMGMSAVTG